MKKISVILSALFLLMGTVRAQNIISDSIFVLPTLDTDPIAGKTKVITMKNRNEDFKPDPVRVLWMGAIIPGYGQIINRSYWKLPIVYAGFLGCTYAITLNSTRYETYKAAYRDISDNSDETNSFLDILPKGYSIESYPGGVSGLKSVITTKYNEYRRSRDLSIIVSVAYYGLTLVEAYVDAQLFDFDISTDLSMHIRPVLLPNQYGRNNMAGVQFSLKLK